MRGGAEESGGHKISEAIELNAGDGQRENGGNRKTILNGGRGKGIWARNPREATENAQS